MFYLTNFGAQLYTILTADECTLTLGDKRPRYGWQLGGTRKTAPITLSRKKKSHVFGALLGDGRFCFRFYEAQNSDVSLAFLGHLHRRFGPVVVFVDNASWHKSVAVRDELAEFKGEVKLRYYYLPHIPELNAEETQWNVMRNAVGNPDQSPAF